MCNKVVGSIFTPHLREPKVYLILPELSGILRRGAMKQAKDEELHPCPR